MKTANDKIYDGVIHRAAMVRLYERRVNGSVSQELLEYEKQVGELITQHPTSSTKFKTLEALFAKLDAKRQSAYTNIYNNSSRGLIDLAMDQLSYTWQNVYASMGELFYPEKPPVQVAEDLVLKRPLHNDQTLAQGWSSVASGERKRLEAVIRKGIREGRSLEQIALDVRKGNIHSISANQSKALVITAVTSVTAQADQEIYKANEAYIQGYQYVAVLDSKTTLVCSHRDGKIFPVGDYVHLPPAHYRCRSTTVPVFKSWGDITKLQALGKVRQRNLAPLSDKQKQFYDGSTPLRESYNDWLLKQPRDIQAQHLGDYKSADLLASGKLTVDKFSNPEGNISTLSELRQLSNRVLTQDGDTLKFANAKAKLDAMPLGIFRPEDAWDPEMQKTLVDYYKLQAGDLDGQLATINYRGILPHIKRQTKQRVLDRAPTEDQLVFNPVTGRYEDVRLYQPNPGVFSNNMKLIDESDVLLAEDKAAIKAVLAGTEDTMSLNHRSAIAANLRTLFERYRRNPDKGVISNFKAMSNAQMSFDIQNVSDAIETTIRKDMDVLKRLQQAGYVDPVLGSVELDKLHKDLVSNILKRNAWEDSVAPKVAKDLSSAFGLTIAKADPKVWARLGQDDIDNFYFKFATRLAMADGPDLDQLAMELGRGLYTAANFNGERNSWYKLGMAILTSDNSQKFFKLETFGVQKRRMKSKMSGAQFGQYYDTLSYNVRVTDQRILDYARLNRQVEMGMRVPNISGKPVLIVRPGYKTYFIDRGVLGLEDTRIPMTSTGSYSDFPVEFVDQALADAMNWTGQTKYKIDPDYYDFVSDMLTWRDDRGMAEKYNALNTLKHHLGERGDSYERIKAAAWLRESGASFSNMPYVDHRGRVYERGLIGPQAGETYRPFLSTEEVLPLGYNGYRNLNDQIGAFLGGASDKLEGRFNGLSVTGRQKIAEKWRAEMVAIGKAMQRRRPADLRYIMDSPLAQEIDGEDIGKFYRLALETAKIDSHVGGVYSEANLRKMLPSYETALALEQDASSSAAQVIALMTKNKNLAELSNVVPTNQKQRLYDVIAHLTFNDPRFRALNTKLGLTEKDLRKGAKAAVMVTGYGAGKRTSILAAEGKLAKALGKQEGTLVVAAKDRDTVLREIDARVAKYERFDPDTAAELRMLRANVKDVFNKGQAPGDMMMEELWFLDPKTRSLVEKMSSNYTKVVTPADFEAVGKLMREHTEAQVPLLVTSTKFFGRLAEDFLLKAKPSEANFDWKSIAKIQFSGARDNKGLKIPKQLSQLLGLKANERVTEKMLKRFAWYHPDGAVANMLYGVRESTTRRTGGKYLKSELRSLDIDPKNLKLFGKTKLSEVEVFHANKLPKSWTGLPTATFDGKFINQVFTQKFEEKIYKTLPDGTRMASILQVPQKTSSSWLDEWSNAEGKMNDIADPVAARTAAGVNATHSSDATLIHRFHLWGRKNNVPTSGVHDAFVANAARMLQARKALRELYADSLNANVFKDTLDEMRRRGLPDDLYHKYLNEAIDTGLIPVAGRSVVNGKVMTEADILKREDIMKELSDDFTKDRYFYGVG